VMSYGCDLIRLSDEAKARGLFLYFTFLGLQKEVVGDPLIEAIAKALSVISASASLEGLKEDPVVRAYRDFYWRLGIDPTKVRPSSEALARRALRGEFPRVSPLVDAGNVASIPMPLFEVLYTFQVKLFGRGRPAGVVTSYGWEPIAKIAAEQVQRSGFKVVEPLVTLRTRPRPEELEKMEELASSMAKAVDEVMASQRTA